ncbi:UNKNOWN [Stylonychia lemnae]|uniref:Uncharacterized protein n=1 Tax=Stylonychia lemnae TaxID=5949 RepID=A0A078ANI8_STYLE|nr:UNKNOWN [Stylonychia lemnae]|eukprot:CDW82533.1 UNKNOWN [Stylonychia lemnae]
MRLEQESFGVEEKFQQNQQLTNDNDFDETFFNEMPTMKGQKMFKFLLQQQENVRNITRIEKGYQELSGKSQQNKWAKRLDERRDRVLNRTANNQSISMNNLKQGGKYSKRDKIDPEEDRAQKEIERQLRMDGQTGLQETDVFILKNVLEVLPQEFFEQKLKKDSLDMDERDIHDMLLSYRSRKKPKSVQKQMVRTRSEFNLTKQTNLTKYDVVAQTKYLRSYFEKEKPTESNSKSSSKQKFGISRQKSYVNSSREALTSSPQRDLFSMRQNSQSLSFYSRKREQQGIHQFQSDELFEGMQPDLRRKMYQHMNQTQSLFQGAQINNQLQVNSIAHKGFLNFDKIRSRAKQINSQFLRDLNSFRQKVQDRSFIDVYGRAK